MKKYAIIITISTWLSVLYNLNASDIYIQPAIAFEENEWVYSDDVLIKVPATDSNYKKFNKLQDLKIFSYSDEQIQMYASLGLEILAIFDTENDNKWIILFKDPNNFTWADYLQKNEQSQMHLTAGSLDSNSLVYTLRMAKLYYADKLDISQFNVLEYENALLLYSKSAICLNLNCDNNDNYSQKLPNDIKNVLQSKLCKGENKSLIVLPLSSNGISDRLFLAKTNNTEKFFTGFMIDVNNHDLSEVTLQRFLIEKTACD